MCIKRIAAECPRRSFVTFNGKEYFVECNEERALAELVTLVSVDGSGSIDVDFRTMVMSHYVSAIEKPKVGPSLCEKELNSIEILF